MQHWLIKSEPFKYSWEEFEKDGETTWDGVRNYQARNHLKAMQSGDLALFYHSNEGKAVVGVARIVQTAFPDPTDAAWISVRVEPVEKLKNPVSLAVIKADERLVEMELLRQSRLSVTRVKPEEFNVILTLGSES
jgi:predicted RNA-binding protein with PUA-like domain